MTHSLTTLCAFCGNEHDRTTAVTEAGTARTEPYPVEGDVTLCIRCGEFSVFDSRVAGGLRRPTPDEREQLDHNPHVQTVVQAWRATVGKG